MILYNKSWINPVGHKYPQIILPKIIEYKRIIPNTKEIVLVLVSDKAFCKEPIGQATVAPGQE